MKTHQMQQKFFHPQNTGYLWKNWKGNTTLLRFLDYSDSSDHKATTALIYTE